jgi:hypothetical protein
MLAHAQNPAGVISGALYRERVLRARRAPPEERIMMGPLLFDYACATIMAWLHSENREATDCELRQLLRQRLALTRTIDEIRASVPKID